MRVGEGLKIVLLCTIAAIAYGIVHDMVTAHVSLEFFTGYVVFRLGGNHRQSGTSGAPIDQNAQGLPGFPNTSKPRDERGRSQIGSGAVNGLT